MRQVTREDLKRMIEDGSDFVLLDVRGYAAYHKEHIPRSISIPLNRIGESAPVECDRNLTIITYCSDFDDRAGAQAAERLRKLGFDDVREFKGGLADWKAAKYTTTRGS